MIGFIEKNATSKKHSQAA